MSYDVSVELTSPTGATTTVFDGNYTSNCAPMWREAGADLRLMRNDGNGAPASECAGVLARAVEDMRADPEKYRAMNPQNGWGDYDSALSFLADVAQACADWPQATVHVHH